MTDAPAGPLWTPSPARVAGTRLDRFRRLVASRHGVDLPDTVALHAWSVEHLGEFWQAVWDTGEVVGDPGSTAFDPGDGTMIGGRFFPEARLNLAENLLVGPPDASDPAIVLPAGGRPAPHAHVGAAAGRGGGDGRRAAGQRRRGPATGWRRGCRTCPRPSWRSWPPTRSARSSRSTSSDFGAAGVVDRFGQIEPTVLFAADGYLYGGKALRLPRAASPSCGPRCPACAQVVVVGNLADEPDLAAVPGIALVRRLHGRATATPSWPSSACPFDHPAAILYSSGTTGAPEVHRPPRRRPAAEAPERAAAPLRRAGRRPRLLLHDVRLDDVELARRRPWRRRRRSCSSTATRSIPSPAALFDLADRYDVTLFGTSAKYLDGGRKAGLRPRRSPPPDQPAHDLLDRLAAGGRGLRVGLRRT